MTTPNLDSLLAEDDWMRQLARRLVRDPNLADDLVQDAWLARLTRSKTGTQRAWVGGVLRNRARRFFRTESRQQVHARAAAKPEATAGADEIASELQLRRALASEMLALDEPIRSAMYMRFVKGDSVRAIATQLSVSPSTVSSRVAQGVAHLRTRLDAQTGGNRSTWHGVAVTIAGTPAANGAFATIAMWSAVISITALTVGTVLVPRSHLPEPLPEVTARVAAGEAETIDAIDPAQNSSRREERSDSRARPASRGSASTEAEPDTQVADDSSTALLKGRVVDEQGRPLVDGSWRIRGTRVEGAQHAKLDAQGAFNIRVPTQRRPTVTLSIECPDRAEVRFRWRGLRPSTTHDAGDVVCPVARTMRCIVVDDAGAPQTGVKWLVSASFRRDAARNMIDTVVRGSCDPATATVNLDGVPEGQVTLRAKDSDVHTSDDRRVRFEHGIDGVHRIVVPDQSARRDRITVSTTSTGLGRQFRPELNQITLIGPGDVRHSAQKVEGRQERQFTEIGPGPFALEIEDPAIETYRREGLLPGDSVTAKLIGCASVNVVVRGRGEPADTRVRVHLDVLRGISSRQSQVAHSGVIADGGVVIGGIVAGTYRLRVETEQGLAQSGELDLRCGSMPTVELALTQAPRVTGFVRRENGDPADGVRVRLVEPAVERDSSATKIFTSRSASSNPGRHRWQGASTRADKEGRFELRAPRYGTHLVFVGTAPGATAETPPFDLTPSAAHREVELIAPEDGNIDGSIVFPAGASPQGWIVSTGSFHAINRPSGLHAILDEKGRFQLGPLPPETTRLYLHSPKGKMWMSDPSDPMRAYLPVGIIEVLPATNTECTLPFPGDPPCHILVKVNLVGETANEILQASGHVVLEATVGRNHFSSRLLENGHAEFFVNTGEYFVSVAGSQMLAPMVETVLAPPGETVEVSLDVSLSAGRLRVTDNGKTIGPKELSIRSRDSNSRVRTRETDAAGWIPLSLAPGTYRLTATMIYDSQGKQFATEFEWPPADGERGMTRSCVPG